MKKREKERNVLHVWPFLKGYDENVAFFAHLSRSCTIRQSKNLCYKSVQRFRVTSLFSGQYNTGEYGTIAGVVRK